MFQEVEPVRRAHLDWDKLSKSANRRCIRLILPFGRGGSCGRSRSMDVIGFFSLFHESYCFVKPLLVSTAVAIRSPGNSKNGLEASVLAGRRLLKSMKKLRITRSSG